MVISHYNLSIAYPQYPTDIAFDSVISQILGVQNSEPGISSWDLWLVEKNNEFVDFITTFLDILEGKYEELEKIGIQRSNIVFFATYEYFGQCNTEFVPEQLARLGANGIALCISCWENPALDDSDREE